MDNIDNKSKENEAADSKEETVESKNFIEHIIEGDLASVKTKSFNQIPARTKWISSYWTCKV